MNPANPAIFLSYASQDADAARRICETLRAAGLEVWFDQSELRGGDAWDASIRKQIKECALFVPIISHNTQTREEGYFRLEWKLAVDRSHLMADNKAYFVPVVLGDVSELAALVPDKFRERQWSHLNDEGAVATFALRVGKLLAGSGASGTSALNAAPAPGFVPAVATPAKSDDTSSIAVLAFANRSASADDEYFSDGLADELLNVLAKIRGLRVAARTSAFSFKGKQSTIAEIGRALNVATVLEGSVRKSGNRVRISVQLVKVADGYQLWSETYDRTLDDIFAVQDDIALSVVKQLRDTLMGAEESGGVQQVEQEVARATATRSEDPEAQRLCLEARFFANKRTHHDAERAISLFQQAMAIDPHFAEAQSGLAYAYVRLAFYGKLRTRDLLTTAKLAAEAALKLDPNQAEPYLVFGQYAYFVSHDPDASRHAYDRALELAPNNAEVHRLAGWQLMMQGLIEEARAELKCAQSLDPLSSMVRVNLSQLDYASGRLDAAERQLKLVAAMDPSWWMPYAHLGRVAQLQGRYAAAVEFRARSLDLRGEPKAAEFLRASFVDGNWQAYLRAIASNRELAHATHVEQAVMYVGLGEFDDAVRCLNNAVDECEEHLWMLKVDPRLAPLHGMPGYTELLARMGLAK